MRLTADLRYACRTILHNPGFALIAILSIALGVGLNSAMFSYVDAILLRPLPVPDTTSIVVVASTAPGTRVGQMSYPDYKDLRDQTHSLSALTCYQLTPMGVSTTRDEVVEMNLGVIASGNFFSGLGIELPIGRGFRPQEDSTPGRDLVTVISHSLWERKFASDPNAIGRKLRINGAEFTLIGVAPAGFTGPEAFLMPDVYVPLNSYPQAIPNSKPDFLTARGNRDFTLFGRLKPHVSQAQAQAELAILTERLAAQYPETNRGRSVAVLNYRQFRFENDSTDAILGLMLMAITSLVLVIACANVANLVLGRGAARAKEIAIRMAIGGSRWQLVRQLLLESLILALAGGAAGIAVAYAAQQFFLTIPLPSDFPISLGMRMDTRLILFSFAVTVVTALVFGLLPALRSTRGDLSVAIKSGDQGPAKAAFWRGRLAGRNLLVMAQLTFSVVLLILSAFFVRGFAAARKVDPGFRVDHTLFFTVDTSLVRYDQAKTREFVRKLEDRLSEQPGVREVSISSKLPFDNQQSWRRLIVDGYRTKPGEDYPSAWANSVDEHFFALMEMPVLRGRAFDVRDTASSPRVVVVNEELAKRLWPGRDAIGQHLRLDRADGPELQVVGVTKTAKYTYWAETPLMALWAPFSQGDASRVVLEIRTADDPAAMAPIARAQVRALDPDMPIIRMSTMMSFYEDRFMLGPRILVQMVTGTGVIGLLLAVIGLYGVVSYAVSRRTREIGIRMAIGARPGDVLRMVLGQGLGFTAAGVTIGTALAMPASKFLKTFVVGVSTHDPEILLSVAAILTLVMIAACWIPARRASRVDPTRALRQD
jgi:macrolide transport system ATP-binding/permease protein